MTSFVPSTIYALASAPGKAGVAIIRVSGPNARLAVEHLCHPATLPSARTSVLRDIQDPHSGLLIDRALVLFFQGPHSFTGEDVVELHIHGGRAVLKAVIGCLSSLEGYRLAEPGEFTRRAFENDKMDLTEAEAVADLVDAETDAQRSQALRQLDGALSRLYEGWRHQLLRSLAHFEAAIDFADEELPEGIVEKESRTLDALNAEIKLHLQDTRGEQLRQGFSVALLGPPNAGKSSLLNALAQKEAAIVSPLAGTTRDVIEVHLDLRGYPVVLADTAGLRVSTDSLESEGIRRALARAEKADIKIIVLDGALGQTIDPVTQNLITPEAIVVVNKADLIAACDRLEDASLYVSAVDGTGMNALIDKIVEKLSSVMAAPTAIAGAAPLTRARHKEALIECSHSLERSTQALTADLRAEDVRLAMRALGRITGRVDVEDLLDIIFRDFCIGK